MSSLAQTCLCRQATVRRFIHTSARSCTSNASGQTWNWLDAIVHDSDQGPGQSSSVAAIPKPKAAFVRNSVFDQRSGKRVTLVCVRPSFQLSAHPQATHPCVRGLTLDVGNVQPYEEPLVVHRLVHFARTQQLKAAARERLSLLNVDPVVKDAVTECQHWNVPFKTRQAWFKYRAYNALGKGTISTGRESPKDFETVTTFVGLDHSSATPDYERGPMSAVLTCLLPADVTINISSTNSLSWLGPPKHVVELLFALGPNALSITHDKPILPSVTRISPARYVLTFADRRARDRLLRYWQRYAARVQDEVGWTPPFVLNADQVDESTSSATVRDRQNTSAALEVHRDTTGDTLWVGNERYTSPEAFIRLVPTSASLASDRPATERKRSRTDLIHTAMAPMSPDAQPCVPTSPVLAALERQHQFSLFDPPTKQSAKTTIALPPRRGRTWLSPVPKETKLRRSSQQSSQAIAQRGPTAR